MTLANLFKSAFILCAFATLAIGADNAKPAESAKPAPQSVVYDAASAFEFFKTLTGDWEHTGDAHDHGNKSNTVSYRTTAGGSAVMETIFAGDPMEMISMYHMDGDKLLLTHYCALQNAPVLQFEKTDKPGEIKFVFVGGTNFDPKTDMHMHEGTYQIKDANTIEASFVGYADGKKGECSTATNKRKPAKDDQAKK